MLNEIKSFCAFNELYETNFSCVPNEKGIYIVKRPKNFDVVFLQDTTAMKEFQGRNMLYNSDELLRKFELSDKEILYIGKAGGNRNMLKQRVRQLVKYGYDLAKNHRGGRVIWQIEDNKNLLLGFKEYPNPEETEIALLEDYLQKYGVLPVGNWRI